MKRNRLVGIVAAAVIGLGTAGTIAAEAGSASAKPLPVLTANTHIVNRFDNGGAGNHWARDTFTRTFKLVYLGKSTDPAHAAKPFMYYGNMTDSKGTFVTIPGKLTPNQGGKYAGRHLPALQFSGVMNGTAGFPLFYASQRAHSGLVPTEIKGSALNQLYPSSTWPKLFFAPGTTFQGVNENPYDYNYFARPVFKIVKGKKVLTGYLRHWEDASWNGDGQLQRDGNIR